MTPRRLEQYPDSLGNSAISDLPAVESAALPDDLAFVLDAWDVLPEPTRQAIFAIVKGAVE
jgi:hypothetical protein